MRRTLLTPILAAFLGASLIACASEKRPAEEAIKAAEDALEAVRAEVAEVVPDQVKTVEDEIASLKARFERGEYTEVIAAAAETTSKANGLAVAAEARKAELEAEAKKEMEALTTVWEEMSEGLPKMVAALEGRVDALSKAKQLPANVEKAAVEEARAGLATISEAWAEAQEAFKGGKIEEAVNKATMVKEKTAELMTKLGMQAPAAAGS